MASPATGGCRCGAVRYRLTAPAIRAGFRHCRMEVLGRSIGSGALRPASP
jgi:hypothetical protein